MTRSRRKPPPPAKAPRVCPVSSRPSRRRTPRCWKPCAARSPAMADPTSRAQIGRQARAWLAANALILDTETTGLDADAEVVELAVIDCAGAVLLDTLVRPS